MPARVILAGYNVDLNALKEYKNRNVILTPESISAAYARISRTPKSIDVLRENARHEIAKARASNRNIIFEMGHHSVAEHAVFNFDIIGISRRAIEELERFRLCAYTEKSQRYVTLKGDYVVPKELEDKALRRDFRSIVRRQNRFYSLLYEKIKEYNYRKFPAQAKTGKGRRLLANWAKEDARYVLSLATQTQVGATINARNLELMIRRFTSHPLIEIQELGMKLFRLVKRIAPSILLFCDANDYDKNTYREIGKHFCNLNVGKTRRHEEDVERLNYTKDGDDRVLAALLFRVLGKSYDACLHAVRKMSNKQRLDLFKRSCAHLELYDVVLREFEYANLSYSLIVSGGCFGQLKRHRMASITWSDYDPGLGITIPESVWAVGEEKRFLEITEETNGLFKEIEKYTPYLGVYILTNAHRRRVLMNLNLRELYHISRLREDPTAQWDIRDKAKKMSGLAKKVFPITTRLLGGKSEYPQIYRKLYGRYPKVKEVPVP
jgi:flavin-dependent thymidylate synthase